MQSIKFILLGIAALLLSGICEMYGIPSASWAAYYCMWVFGVIGIILCIIGAVIPIKRKDDENKNNSDKKD